MLDLTGEESAVGKSLGTDLEKRKATLPVIHMLATATAEDARRSCRLTRPENHRAADLLPWLDRYQSLEYARQKAGEFAAAAIADLQQLPASLEREVLSGRWA